MLFLIKNKNFRYFLIYSLVTILSLLTTIIYYRNSHGETDIHMSILFLPGAIMMVMFIVMFYTKFEFDKMTYYLLNSAFLFIWLYMLISGIYLIAYVESDWRFVFWVVSLVVFLIALTNEIIYRIKKNKNPSHFK